MQSSVLETALGKATLEERWHWPVWQARTKRSQAFASTCSLPTSENTLSDFCRKAGSQSEEQEFKMSFYSSANWNLVS